MSQNVMQVDDAFNSVLMVLSSSSITFILRLKDFTFPLSHWERERKRERESDAKVLVSLDWSMKKPALGVPCACWFGLGHRPTWKPLFRKLGPISQSPGVGGRGQGELHTSCSVPTGEGAGSSVPWRGVLGGACWTAGNRWFHLLIVTLL